MNTRRIVLQALLGAVLATSVVSVFVSLQRRSDIAAFTTGGTSIDDIHVGDLLGERTTWILVAAALLHAVAFGVFFHRAYKLLDGRVAVEGNAGVAAASFFLPFANFVLPVRTAHNLLRAVRAEATGLLVAWWLPFLGAVLARRLAGSNFEQAIDENDLDGARSALLLDAVGSAGLAVAVVAAVFVVARIATGVDSAAARVADGALVVTP